MNTLIWEHHDKPNYIAISEHGYGCHQIPAAAIRLAQDEVPAKSKPRQLLIYSTFDDIEPTGWKDNAPVWPNGAAKKIRLVGLTTTHRLFIQSYKGREHV